jgi:hypothetical protein
VSVAEDVDTNPHRGAMFILQKAIHRHAALSEFPLSLMLSGLAGMKQFSYSQGFTHINIYPLIKDVFRILKEMEERDENLMKLCFDVDIDLLAAELCERGINDESDGIGQVVVDAEGVVNVACCYDDYRSRGQFLAHLSPLEYVMFIKKELKSASDTEERTSNAGRPRSNRIEFESTSENHPVHPQLNTHIQVISIVWNIPLLVGDYIPKFPGIDKPDGDDGAQLIWSTACKNWASFFVCLLTPFDIYTGLPIIPFSSLNPLMDWLTQEFDDINSIDCIQRKGAFRYLINCKTASFRDSFQERKTKMFRKQSTDSYEFYLQQQAKGCRHGAGPNGEQENNLQHKSGRHHDADDEEIRDIAESIRHVMEKRQEAGFDEENEYRRLNAEAIFTDLLFDVPMVGNGSNALFVRDTASEVCIRDYEKLKTYTLIGSVVDAASVAAAPPKTNSRQARINRCFQQNEIMAVQNNAIKLELECIDIMVNGGTLKSLVNGIEKIEVFKGCNTKQLQLYSKFAKLSEVMFSSKKRKKSFTQVSHILYVVLLFDFVFNIFV